MSLPGVDQVLCPSQHPPPMLDLLNWGSPELASRRLGYSVADLVVVARMT